MIYDHNKLRNWVKHEQIWTFWTVSLLMCHITSSERQTSCICYERLIIETNNGEYYTCNCCIIARWPLILLSKEDPMCVTWNYCDVTLITTLLKSFQAKCQRVWSSVTVVHKLLSFLHVLLYLFHTSTPWGENSRCSTEKEPLLQNRERDNKKKHSHICKCSTFRHASSGHTIFSKYYPELLDQRVFGSSVPNAAASFLVGVELWCTGSSSFLGRILPLCQPESLSWHCVLLRRLINTPRPYIIIRPCALCVYVCLVNESPTRLCWLLSNKQTMRQQQNPFKSPCWKKTPTGTTLASFLSASKWGGCISDAVLWVANCQSQNSITGSSHLNTWPPN